MTKHSSTYSYLALSLPVVGFPGASDGKESEAMQIWVRSIPWRRERLPVPVFLPGEFPGQRSLVDCSPRGHKKLDTVEQLTHNILYLLKRLSSISIG